jgi:hypothetical protein
VLADGDGSVTVQVEPVLLFINHVSVDATLKSAVLVTGAFVVMVPLVLNVPVAKVNPAPTVTLLNPPAPLPYKIDVPLVAGA